MARASPAAVIGDIYDAALATDGFERLAAIMTRAGRGGSAVVGVADAAGSVEGATSGLPDEALRRYAAYYHTVNPFFAAALAAGPQLEPKYSLDLVSEIAFRQSEFYFDFTRGLDTFQFVGGLFQVAPDRYCELGIHRGERSSRFDDRDVRRVGRLTPHLQRALQIRMKLGVEDRPNLGFAALEALSAGCVIVAPEGRILFANAAAKSACAAGGLTLGGGRSGVGAIRADEASRLSALLADVVAGGSGGATATTGPDGARLFLLIAPLPPRFGVAPGHALVTIRAERARSVIDEPSLKRIFGLTPAEARLALGLAEGRSLADLRDRHGVSSNTLRTQLAAVLRKTDTASQRELVRLLGLVPQLGAPADGVPHAPR
jgi:DNA-binding CsgD family transcriptional regulator